MTRKIPRIILASSSPRRQDLLKTIGLSFTVVVPDVEEVRAAGESPYDYVRRNSELKCTAVCEKLGTDFKDAIVIAADTIVVLGSQVLEKPQSIQDARSMLSALSGKTHEVLTGVALAHQRLNRLEKREGLVVSTRVTFKNLAAREIDSYIASGEPMDKAGAYAAQGRGSYFVKEIVGSYTNVVGLPTAEVAELLRDKFGYEF